MPPILVALAILFGALTASPLVKGLDPRPDGGTRSHFGKPAPQAYRTWTSRSWVALPDPQYKVCDVTYFAMANRNKVTRLHVGGVEQNLDWSWSFPRVLKAGEKHTVAFEFRDPSSGAQLACQEQTVDCVGGSASTDTREGECRPEALPPGARDKVKPELVGSAPPMVMFNAAVGGAEVTLDFVIRGKVNEAWWCPRLDVEWPDGTRTSRESDCAPFADAGTVQRWAFTRVFPGGEWTVKACISKAGRQIACTRVVVRVVGAGE